MEIPGAFAGLRSLANSGGCAAKADPALVALLTAMAAGAGRDDPAVLAGLRPFDDAAVYQLDSERALVATVDFFPPLVDDPADYGAVAAANAISDIYAMGAELAFALAISGFPAQVPEPVVAAATRAAAKVVKECGGQLLGGHSIRCQEPIFGLCALGFVHPERVWRKSGARPGDVLVLSKPLGIGMLLAEDSHSSVATAVSAMRETNRRAAAALSAIEPHAVTDVTGYGLIGHGLEMAQRSNLRLVVRADTVPLLPGALAAAEHGVRTSADGRIRTQCAGHVDLSPRLSEALAALLYDPQTSGGLLAAVDAAHVEELERQGFARLGGTVPGSPGVTVE